MEAVSSIDGVVPIDARPVWRPPWQAWMLIGLGAFVATYALYPERLQGHWKIATPVAIAFGTLVLRRLWELPPAIIMCVAMPLTVFSGAWGQIGLGGLPFNRLLIVIALLQVFLRAPGAAHLPPLRVRDVHLLMCATVLYAIGSAAVAGTIKQGDSLLVLTDVLGLMPFLLFLVTPAIFATERERNLLLATLVGLGAYLGITTVLESLGPHNLVFPSYIVNNDTIRPGILRPGGPFQSPVENGFANFASAVAATMACMRWEGKRRHLAVLVGGLCLFACFLTLERAVWIAAPVAIAVTAACTRTGRRWLVPGAIAAVIAIGAVLTVFPALSQRTHERANTQQSVWDRKNMTSAGLRMVAEKPLFGFGWDRYERDSREYFRQSPDYPMTGYTPVVTIGLPEILQPLHNTYLAYAVELGLVGFVLWLASLLWAIVGAIVARGPSELRQWKLGLLAAFVFFLIVSFVDPHELPFPVVMLMIWAGVASGGGQRVPDYAPPLPSEAEAHPAPVVT